MRQIQAIKSGIGQRRLVTYQGLSTESKPLLGGEMDGTRLQCVDTDVEYIYYSGMWYPDGGGQGIPGEGGVPGGDTAPGLNEAQTALVQTKVAEFAAGPTALNLAIVADPHANDRIDTGALDYSSTSRALTNLYEMVYARELYPEIHALVMLGDNAGRSGASLTAAQSLDVFSRLTTPLLTSSAPVFTLRGNHDDNGDSGSTSASIFTPDEYHDTFVGPFKATNGAVHDSQRPKSNYFYRDFPSQKVRLVGLDFLDYPYMFSSGTTLKYKGGDFSAARPGWGFGPRQVTWLAEEALDFSGKSDAAEWATVVFAHFLGKAPTDRMASGYYWNGDLIFGVLDAYNQKTTYTGTSTDTDWGVSVTVDFSADTTAGIIAYMVGHQHQDFYIPAHGETLGGDATWKVNDYSFPIVGFTRGYRSVDGCNELVSIDRENERIHTLTIAPNSAMTGTIVVPARTIPFQEAEPGDQYVKLLQGSKTYVGVTVTVAGNRVTVNGTPTNQQSGTMITGPSMASGNVNTTPAAHLEEEVLKMEVGDVFKCVIANVTGNFETEISTHGLVRPFFSDGSRPTGVTPTIYVNDPDGAAAPTDTLANIMIALGSGPITWNNYSFDLEVYINGVSIPVGA